MKLLYNPFLTLFLLVHLVGCAQVPTDRPHLNNPAFDKQVSELIHFSIPLLSVEDLNQNLSDYIVFDTREKEEYLVSYIEGAKYLGYKEFDASVIENLPKDSKIVLYCSVGYRSEKIGEKLIAMGFENVYNLFGSIFEWANRGYKVVDIHGQETKKIHVYNQNWSKWLDASGVEKIW